MKRRQLIRYVGAGLVTALGTVIVSEFQSYQAQTQDSLSVRWLGHTCFLFTGNGLRVLVNPFRTLGCTAGYRSPQVEADLVLVSSQLLDEAAVEEVAGNPRVLSEPGVYQFKGLEVEGIPIDHDRVGEGDWARM